MRRIKLKREAGLLDSKYFIIKAAIAVFVAYLISNNNPFLRKDTISVLFGMMLTLEPVNLTGILGGLRQLYATIIGAVFSSIIIYFIGINPVSVALAVAFSIYVCLKINYRKVSPVAIFTSIYMTQYIQLDALGNPSIFLTLSLRLGALVFGILIAVFINFIFSFIYYKKIWDKRVIFLLEESNINLNLILDDNILKVVNSLPNSFNNIEWVYSMYRDMLQEYKMLRRDTGEIDKYDNIFKSIRAIAHCNYDMGIYLLDKNERLDEYQKKYICKEIKNIEMIIASINGSKLVIEDFVGENKGRIWEDVLIINDNIKEIIHYFSNTRGLKDEI